jgi:hypothetical protein
MKIKMFVLDMYYSWCLRRLRRNVKWFCDNIDLDK